LRGLIPAQGKVKGKQFFFEKKNQKTFEPWGARWIHGAPKDQKFLLLFSKRSAF
jgi:hypothetical protein